MIVLSIFPGIDLLGRGFEDVGFCIVRGPDLLWGGDIGNFHPPPHTFAGVIGGTPCQDFSTARRAPPTGYGLQMLNEFRRIVIECWPTWFLLENVPRVPDIAVEGYAVQRFDLNARDCDLPQRRLRHFQFGSYEGSGLQLLLERRKPVGKAQPPCLATEGKRPDRRGWKEFCALQGLPPLQLPGMSIAARYAAVGNGVPISMARMIARAILVAYHRKASNVTVRLCACQCGRPVAGKQTTATPACRKRLERRRRDAAKLAKASSVTPNCDPATA